MPKQYSVDKAIEVAALVSEGIEKRWPYGTYWLTIFPSR